MVEPMRGPRMPGVVSDCPALPVDVEPATAAAIDRVISVWQWDRQTIPGTLAVGDWASVAGQVLDYFCWAPRKECSISYARNR